VTGFDIDSSKYNNQPER